MVVENGLLGKTYDTNQCSIVVSFQFAVEVVSKVHTSLAHVGRHKLVDTVGRYFWHLVANEENWQ